MNYTLNQLQIFLKVTQNQSITKAAEELNLTQPAVSIQLKNFQDQFEIPLTEVIGRQLYVTDFGKEIIKLTGTNQKLVFQPLPKDDPKQRQPEITKAKTMINMINNTANWLYPDAVAGVDTGTLV